MNNALKNVTVILMTVLLTFSTVLAVYSRSPYANRQDSDEIEETTAPVLELPEPDAAAEVIAEAPVLDTFEIINIKGGDPLCEHYWPSWIDMIPSAVGRVGSAISYCSFCGALQTKVLEALPDPEDRFMLDVKNILQNPELPNGCEIVSLAIVLNHLGFEVDPVKLSDEYLPKGQYWYDSPYEKYIGDPKGNGTGCYAKCLTETANKFLKDKGSNLVCCDVSGMSLGELEAYVDKGIPVIIWGTVFMDCDPKVSYSYWYGNEVVTWYSHSHCLVMIGHSAYTYIFADPLCGITNYDRADVLKSYEQIFTQACIIREPDEIKK